MRGKNEKLVMRLFEERGKMEWALSGMRSSNERDRGFGSYSLGQSFCIRTRFLARLSLREISLVPGK